MLNREQLLVLPSDSRTWVTYLGVNAAGELLDKSVHHQFRNFIRLLKRTLNR